MKYSTQKLLTWVAWVVMLLILCLYFTLHGSDVELPLLIKFGKELRNLVLPYVFFPFFQASAFARKEYRKMLYLIVLDIIFIALIVGGFYLLSVKKTLVEFFNRLLIGFSVFKALLFSASKTSKEDK